METATCKAITARRPGWISRWALAVALLLPASVIAATFSTSLSRDTVIMGETVTLSLKLEGGQFPGNPSLPPIAGVDVVPGLNQSVNSYQGPDGRMTSAHTFNYTLVPQRAGEITIPALNLEINGQRFSSQPLKLQVLSADPFAPPPELGNELAFVWLALPKTEFFLGEPFIAELRLYVRQGVQNISDFRLPTIATAGFTASKMVAGQNFERRVGSAQFTVVPQLVALTPVKSGPLKLGGVSGTVVLHLPYEGRRQRDVFSFFGPQTEPRQVEIKLGEVPLRVLPLPQENVPANFSGAIGNFTLEFNAGPTNVTTGDPITVKVQIAGNGSLDSISLPPQPAWNDFKSYPPTVATQPTDQFGLRGVKAFEQVVSPESTDVKELPAFSFSFFDPEAKQYRTLTQPAVKLTVRPGGVVAAPSISAPKPGTSDTPPPPQDIVPIKQRLGTLTKPGPPLIHQTWFVAAQGIPLLAFVGAFIWRRRADALANNPRLRRQRQVARVVSEGLVQLQQLAGTKNSAEFFALMFRLMQEQIGERLNMPASSITEAVVEERLASRAVAETTRATLHELFQTCNVARNAPVQSSQELAALIPKLANALKELQEVKL